MKLPKENPYKLTPREFELQVKSVLDDQGLALDDYESHHLERIRGRSGGYEIDITARFKALGVEFLVLIECKRLSRCIERSDVQILEQKRGECAAQKAILFSTSKFRNGAVEFATELGVALINMRRGGIVRVCGATPTHMQETAGCLAWLLGNWTPVPPTATLVHTSRRGYTEEVLAGIYTGRRPGNGAAQKSPVEMQMPSGPSRLIEYLRPGE